MYLAPFPILLPQMLPPRSRRRSEPALALAEACRSWLVQAHEAGAAERLDELLGRHAPWAGTSPAMLDNEGEATHDGYFHICRVGGGDPSLVLAGSLARATRLLLHECSEAPTRLEVHRLQALVAALMRCAIDTPAPRVGPQGAMSISCRPEQPVQSMRRWLRGHQVFAALTQALIVELQRLSVAVWAAADGESSEVPEAIGGLVGLLDAACTTLELTGDFPAEDYQTLIRPSMMPPHLPDSFSGLLSADHRVFVFRLRSMAPELEALRLADPALHAQLHAALARVYDSHRFVCERFVGDAPSLRETGDGAHGGAKIEKYKAARLRVFSPPGATGPGARTAGEPEPARPCVRSAI